MNLLTREVLNQTIAEAIDATREKFVQKMRYTNGMRKIWMN